MRSEDVIQVQMSGALWSAQFLIFHLPRFLAKVTDISVIHHDTHA